MICFLLPSLIGITRALQLSPYVYTTTHLNQIYNNMHLFTRQDTLTIIRSSITDCVQHGAGTPSRRILDKYWQQNDPLTPNRMIYDTMVLLRNILARHLCNTAPPQLESLVEGTTPHLTRGIMQAWSTLIRTPVARQDDDETGKHLRAMYVTSMDYYQDLQKKGSTAKTWYRMEIMGTCLVSG
jgi:phosphatidylinositol 4-kinase